jgi:hypothetical protein
VNVHVYCLFFLSLRTVLLPLLSPKIKRNNRQKILCGETREYLMIYRGAGFLAVVMIWFFTPARQQAVYLSQSSCVPPVELTDGRGGVGAK